MSNAVYPALPGLAWPTKRTPLWKTKVSTTPSGREFRTAPMLLPRYRYTLQYDFLRSAAALQEYQTLFGFFNARGGAFDTFVYRDPDDNAVASQLFGTTDGTTTQFTLLRALGGYAEPVGAVSGVPVVEMTGGQGGYGSFEADSNADGLADGWSVFVGGTGDASRVHAISRQTNYAVAHGTYAQELQINSTTNSNDSGLSSAMFSIAPSLQYILQGSLYCSVASKAYFLLRFYDAALAQVGGDFTTAYAPAGAAAILSVSGVAPGAAVYAQISARGINAATQFLRADAISLSPGATAAAPTATKMALTVGLDYSIGSNYITLARPSTAGGVLTWSGSYYWRCRFDTDELPFEQFMGQFWKTGEVKLITVKP